MKVIKSIIPALALILVFSAIGPVFADYPTVSVGIEPNTNLSVGDTVNIYVNVENTYILDVYPVNVYAPVPDGLQYVSFNIPDKTLQNYNSDTGIWGPFRMRHEERGKVKGLIITCKVLPEAAGKQITAYARFSQVAIELNGRDITSLLRPSSDVTGVTTYVPPVAGFIATPINGNAPLAVHFTDTSTKGPTSWIWDFGDGSTSTRQDPTHTYTTPGTYTVKLTVRNDMGSDTTTKTITVNGKPGTGGGDDGGNGTGNGPSSGNGNNLIDAMKNLSISSENNPLSNLQKGGGGNGKAYEIEVPQAQNDPLTPYILAILLIIGLIAIGYFYGIENRR